MTDRAISDYVTAREEIRSESDEITTSGLLDEVRLYNLYDKKTAPEKNAERILDITYPTNTLVSIIKQVVGKLDSTHENNEGGHVIGGNYGTGKSHIQLAIYHLLSSPEVGQSWLDSHDIDVTLPTGTDAAALQMLNLDGSYQRLWHAVGNYLDIEAWTDTEEVPSAPSIRDALEDVPTVLFIDEFERWYGMATRTEYRQDNKAFIQNLLEAAGRDDTPLAVFVAYLFENEELSEILTRTNLFTWDLDSRRDEKLRFIRHRLVGEPDDPEGVAAVAKEYADVYRQNAQIELDDYQSIQDDIEAWYPFHPHLLALLMEKFSEESSHQDARGLLDFLVAVLADAYHETDLVLTRDVDVYSYIDRLRFIDGDLISRYTSDYHRLGKATDDDSDERAFEPLVEELLNIVLLHSLTRGGDEGANKRQILVGTMRKGIGARNVLQTFTEQVYGHAWHVHRLNGEYAFDTDENPAARIEKAAGDVTKTDAVQRIERLVTDQLFGGRSDVMLHAPAKTEQDIPDSKSLKVVVSLAAKRDYNDLFAELTDGREFPNTLVLVTPAKQAGIDTNTGIIELARKVVASETLGREETTLPDRFDEVRDQHYQNLHDRVRDKFGTVHVPTDKGLFPHTITAGSDGELYAPVVEAVAADPATLRSEVSGIVADAGGGGIQYEYLCKDFYRNVAYSTLTDTDALESAVGDLCKQGEVKVGSYFEEYVGSLGSDTVLVAASYVDTGTDDEGGDADDEPATITIDPTGSTSGGGDTATAGSAGSKGPTGASTSSSTQSASSGSATESRSGAAEAFHCPQCGAELADSECTNCGFSFETSDLEDGTVTVEGGSADELIRQFNGLHPPETDVEAEMGTQSVERYPPFASIEADNKPSLIDSIERKVESSWEIHEATVMRMGGLAAEEFSHHGLDGGLDASTGVEEELTLTIDPEPDSPLSAQDLLGVMSALDAPADAGFEVWLKVNKQKNDD
jgi:hypothetical protein